MDEQAVRALVRQVIAETAPVQHGAIVASTSLRGDLGYDSLGLLELAAMLEQALGLDAGPEDDAADLDNVAELEQLVLETLALRGGEAR